MSIVVEEYKKVGEYYYFVKPFDTLNSIASSFNVPTELIKQVNGVETVAEGDILVITGIGTKVHTVLPLESLSKIASNYGVSVDYIIKKNKITTIFVGQKLYI